MSPCGGLRGCVRPMAVVPISGSTGGCRVMRGREHSACDTQQKIASRRYPTDDTQRVTRNRRRAAGDTPMTTTRMRSFMFILLTESAENLAFL